MTLDRRTLLTAAGALALPGAALAQTPNTCPASLKINDRLRSAARHAYFIPGTGPMNGTGSECGPPVGYQGEIFGVIADSSGIDAGLVANIPEGVIISIRGTLNPLGIFADKVKPQTIANIVLDWMNNTGILLTPPTALTLQFPGRYHTGFAQSAKNIWDLLGPKAQAAIEARPNVPIYITGHSKGGAICPLIAWTLSQRYGSHPIVVRTFAAPRFADDAFAHAYDDAVPDHIRFEFDDDLVPHLPLQTETAAKISPLLQFVVAADPGYGAVGSLRFIRANGQIEPGDDDALLDERMLHFRNTLFSPNADHIRQCHAIEAPGDGYVKANYP